MPERDTAQNTQGWMPIVAMVGFALAGAVALGYALLWTQGKNFASIFDIFAPQNDVTEEEKARLLAILRNEGAEVSEEEKRNTLSAIQPETTVEMTEEELQRRAVLLESLREN